LVGIVHPPGVRLEFSQNLYTTHPPRVSVFIALLSQNQSRLLGYIWMRKFVGIKDGRVCFGENQ